MVNKNRVYNKDPEVIEYWNIREYLNAFNQIESIKRSRLFSKQKGICPHCKGTIKQQDIQEQETHVHHVIPRSNGGKDSYSNLRLLHTECHREIHSSS
jgi:RNA-directed DNA polymerase